MVLHIWYKKISKLASKILKMLCDSFFVFAMMMIAVPGHGQE